MASPTSGGARSGAKRCAVLIALLGACGGPSTPPAGSRLAPAIAAALDAADRLRAPWRCAASDGPVLADETLTLGDRTWTVSRHSVTAGGTGTATIGVIADAGGAAPATLAALGALRGKLATVDVVIALGGMGATQGELEATLGALADRAAWPIVALPGDLEPAGAQAAAIAALRTRGHVVLDGRLVRRIELPGVTIATIPGAGAVSRLAAGAEGCGYRPEDVTAVFSDLTPRASVRIVASAEAPRITAHGEPAGELVLTAGATHEIDIALHGPTTETASPGRGGERDGSAAALTPGSSDATTRLPGPGRASTAGILTVTGNAWRWKPVTDTDR